MGYICRISSDILRNYISKVSIATYFAVLYIHLINYDKLITFLDSVNADCEVINQYKQVFLNTRELQSDCFLYTSGWNNLDGVMLMRPDTTYKSDYLVYLIATTERSVRELLLAFPRKSVGMFYLTENWIENRIQEMYVGESILAESTRYFRGVKRGSDTDAEQRTITKKKDDIASHIRQIASNKGKIDHSKFVVENDMLVKRAFSDGQPIDAVLYTTNFLSTTENKTFLMDVIQENISCYLINDGLMGTVTTTRPVPTIIALIHYNYPRFLTESGELNFHFNKNCNLLITENVSNPDNLGMIFRSIDASGISGVLLCGDGASPFHKNTIRASRGAVGRLPIYYTSDTIKSIEQLKLFGWKVFGATASGDTDLYNVELSNNTAIVVGNENSGLSNETRDQCSQLIRIPMASGQSSLNVGVASGILLYDIVRNKFMDV